MLFTGQVVSHFPWFESERLRDPHVRLHELHGCTLNWRGEEVIGEHRADINLGFGISAGYEDLMAGDCTSCEVTQDKSVYWHPALYFQHASGEFEVVPQIGGMLA